MDPLPEHGIISEDADNEEWERVLDRLRRNDPTLKALTLCDSAQWHGEPLQIFIKAKECWTKLLYVFDAIATNSSLKMLEIAGEVDVAINFRAEDRELDRMKRAFSLNTSLKDIRIDVFSWSSSLLDIVMASPNLEFLTARNFTGETPSIEDIAAMAQVLRVHMCNNMNLLSLTFERLLMDSYMATAFATAFQGNQTIKTLIMRDNSVNATGAVSFVGALPHDHSLETIIFEGNHFDDDSAVRIVRTLCRKHLKVLSLAGNEITGKGCERIIQTLRENEHSLTKLDLLRHSRDSMWPNFIRLEIEKLTWKNRLQVEKDTWADRFLEQDAPTKELLFRALERAKKVDNERFAPNMLFYLIKESPDLIVQAIREGL